MRMLRAPRPLLLRILDFGGEEDGAGAGAEGGLGVDEIFQLCEAFFTQEFQEGAGFAAGDDEAVEGVELLRLFDEDDVGAEFFEAAAVGVEIALQGQDSDLHAGIDFSGCGFVGVKGRGPQRPGPEILERFSGLAQ